MEKIREEEESARLKRINELAAKAKTVGLTAEETAERNMLRKEFLTIFRDNMRATIEQIEIVEEDGSHTQVVKKQ